MKLSEEKIKSILNEIKNNNTFIGTYDIVKQILEYENEGRLYVPQYKFLKIYQIIEGYIEVEPYLYNIDKYKK